MVGTLNTTTRGALETEWDSEYIQAALAVNPNVTFFSSSGDDGSFPDSLIYPSVSPEVVSVGGTSLFLGSQNQWANETGWSGSGGGISTTFTKPSYQDNTGITTAFRTDPDVSAVADPATGVAVYDPFDFGTTTPWEQIGGTSLAAPVWAGMMTIADQGRALFGASPLGSPQTLNYLYSFPQSDFHDVTEGNSGLYSAGPGYDLVTGRGSPIANVVVPALATAGVTVQVVTTQPPTTVIQGGKFGTVVEAQFPATGAIATDFVGNATISLESGPTGATFTPVTVPFTNGVAVFDGLSLSTLSNGTPYTFTITVTSGSLTLRTLTPDSVDVATAATPDVGVYYPLPLDSSLRGDAAAANADPTNATDDLYLVYSTPYDLTAGQLVLHNTSSLPSKTLQFLGDDEFATTTPAISAGSLSRVFDIVGTSPLSVLFNGLVIEGGSASAASTDGAIGGGLLIDGGSVRLSNVTLQGNQASGGAGASGAPGNAVSAGPGGPGASGGSGKGGGIYISTGTLTLNDDIITGNVAKGGNGGIGGTGGKGPGMTGGAGGAGGAGGSAAGGASSSPEAACRSRAAPSRAIARSVALADRGALVDQAPPAISLAVWAVRQAAAAAVPEPAFT